VKSILKNILAILDKREKKQFGILIVLDLFINVADILSLAVLLWIIQFYIQPEHKNNLSFLPLWLLNRSSVLFIAIFVILFAIKNCAAFLISKAYHVFSSKVAVRISYNNLVSYQQAQFSTFVNVDSSAHIRNICFQPFEFCQYMLSGIQQVITQVSLILLTIIAIILFNAKLFLLLLLILLPPVVIVFYFIKKRLTAAKTHIRENNERSFQYLLDALKGYVESNIYNRNNFFLQRFIRIRKKFSIHLFGMMAMQNLPNRIIEIFAVLGLFILIAIAKWTDDNNNATLITIGAFMAAAYKIIPGIVKVINVTGQIRAYEFSLNELQHAQKENDFFDAATTIPAVNSIEFKNISFQYAGHHVLHDFSLLIGKGDFVAITGQSGKGKTTLLNLLLGFLPTEKGEICINNNSIGTDTLKNYWPAIAYVRQQPFFIHGTIQQNITLEETGYNEERLQHALKFSGLEEFIGQSKEGLNKIITENGKNISGGQQQRISIARALYKNAAIILLDEPFSELDEASANAMLNQLKNMASEGKIIMMITHDKKSLSYCNKIISLDE